VVYKGKKAFVIMNKYPYNSGHIMVCPKSHVAELEDIPAEEKMELLELLEVSIRALRKAIKPHGFNIGINMGRAAGAGLEDHIHIHVVPRWVGDTNFMPICSDVKIIIEDINSSMQKIKNYLNEAIIEEQKAKQ
jgi:ATP adenylyltransferase